MQIRDAQSLMLMAAAGVAVAAVVWVMSKGARGAARDAAGAITDIVGSAAVGTVEGIGISIGIPVTDKTECEKALADGRTWDASFACPAGTFIKSIFN